MSDFYSLTVASIQRLTPTSVAVSFTIPKALTQTFAFTAGQYITIKKEVKGKELRRAYSISSSPKKEEITIGIKKVDRGGFSNYANEDLKEGDVLEVMPPDGRFTFKSSDAKNVAAFAAGSGITPILSIAKTVLESNDKSKFVLVYGNKSFEEAMFYTDIMGLELQYPNRFSVYFTNSQAMEENALFGRIDTATVNYALKNKHKEVVFDGYYLCGPEKMIRLVTTTLEENGAAKDTIHFELFTATSDKKEVLPTAGNDKTTLTVIVDEEEFELTMDKSELILDAVLKKNIDAPYSCQGGVCSSCIAKVTEGKAEMVKNQILTDDEIEDGFILTCQAHPVTATLKVNYDDV